MIKKLDFNNYETITEQGEVIADKIDEIIDVVNSLKTSIEELRCGVTNIAANSDIKQVDNLKATKANITNLEFRPLKY